MGSLGLMKRAVVLSQIAVFIKNANVPDKFPSVYGHDHTFFNAPKCIDWRKKSKKIIAHKKQEHFCKARPKIRRQLCRDCNRSEWAICFLVFFTRRQSIFGLVVMNFCFSYILKSCGRGWCVRERKRERLSIFSVWLETVLLNRMNVHMLRLIRFSFSLTTYGFTPTFQPNVILLLLWLPHIAINISSLLYRWKIGQWVAGVSGRWILLLHVCVV